MVEFQFLPGTDGRSSFNRAVNQLQSPISKLHVASPNLTLNRIEQFQDNFDGNLHDVPQEWIVGLGGLTEFDALEKLRTEFDADVYVTNDGHASFSSVGFGSEHVWAERDDYHDLFVSGGSNGHILTRSGGFGMILTDLHHTTHESELDRVRDWWMSTRDAAGEFTDGIANEYSQLRNTYPDWVLSTRGVPVPRTPTDRVEDASLLWSEVHSAQGAARSQIDLPRRCSPFFAGNSRELEITEQVSINVFAGGQSYPGKEVRLHENEMLRPNLPTELLDYFDLIDSVVVFYHLQNDDFGVILIPSEVADSYLTLLQEYCDQHGEVHEMKGGRTCGWV